MIQTQLKDNVPLFWSTMTQVKTNHYSSMAHYFVAVALLDHQCKGKSFIMLRPPRYLQRLAHAPLPVPVVLRNSRQDPHRPFPGVIDTTKTLRANKGDVGGGLSQQLT